MNRREMLKILGGAVAVAALPISLPPTVVAASSRFHSEPPEFYSDGEAAFVVIPAPHDTRAGHFVMWNDKPLGVACDTVARGRRVLVQVYGETRVHVA